MNSWSDKSQQPNDTLEIKLMIALGLSMICGLARGILPIAVRFTISTCESGVSVAEALMWRASSRNSSGKGPLAEESEVPGGKFRFLNDAPP